MSARRHDQKSGKPATVRRTGKGFRHASETVRKSLDQVVGRKGFAESEVLLRWPEIIGEALAQTCNPVKVHYGTNRQIGATLVVQANSGRAPEVMHLAPKIIERVNRFYGYRAISRVKVTQSNELKIAADPVRGFAETQTAFSPPDSPADARYRKLAGDLAKSIQDDGLRTALALMGSHILQRARKND